MRTAFSRVGEDYYEQHSVFRKHAHQKCKSMSNSTPPTPPPPTRKSTTACTDLWGSSRGLPAFRSSSPRSPRSHRHSTHTRRCYRRCSHHRRTVGTLERSRCLPCRRRTRRRGYRCGKPILKRWPASFIGNEQHEMGHCCRSLTRKVAAPTPKGKAEREESSTQQRVNVCTYHCRRIIIGYTTAVKKKPSRILCEHDAQNRSLKTTRCSCEVVCSRSKRY